MTKAFTKTNTLGFMYRTYATYVLIAACFGLIVMYSFSIYKVISHTVAVKGVEKEITALSSSVDDLEAKYTKISSAIHPESITKFGLTHGRVTSYIPRTASLGKVAMLGHEF